MKRLMFTILMSGLFAGCVSDPMNLKKWYQTDGSAANSELVREAYNDCKYGYHHRRFLSNTTGERFREWKDAESCMKQRGFIFIHE